MSKLIAATYRAKNVVTILETIIADAKKAVASALENQDFEYLVSWKAFELAQANTAKNLLGKIDSIRQNAATDQSEEEIDRAIVAMMIAESWKLSMGTSIHNSTASASNLVNEAKIELGRKLMLALGMDSYYLHESVAAAILDDIAPLSK